MGYQHAPQRRDESLQPLSRDHYQGLVHAEHLRKSGLEDGDASSRQKALSEFVEGWDNEIADHFAEEERLLIELMTEEETNELYAQHRNLRSLADEAKTRQTWDDPGADWCRSLGEALRDHIRWEERTLFPAVQGRATPEQLEALAEHTAPIEQRRGRCR
jgi:iron-sulfur cluster repair protein YtfE (RIC family)